MAPRSQRFTESIGVKVTKEQLLYLQMLADREQKPLAEWCRDVLLTSTKRPSATFFERALMAELAATQNITITLIYEMANGLALNQDRVHRILNNNHAAKFQDADERLEQAVSRAAENRPAMSNPSDKEDGTER